MACINQASSVPTILTTSFIIVVFFTLGPSMQEQVIKNGKSEGKSGNKYEINIKLINQSVTVQT